MLDNNKKMGRNFMYLLIEKRLGYLSLYLPLFLLSPAAPTRKLPPYPPREKKPGFYTLCRCTPINTSEPSP